MLIPASEDGTDALNNALTEIWALALKVEDVGAEDVLPLPFVVDWTTFAKDVESSFAETAYERFRAWTAPLRKRKAAETGSSSKRRKS